MTTLVNKKTRAAAAVELSSKSKNEEIAAAMASNADFNKGLAVCAAVEETSNEDYLRVMFVQKRVTNNSLNALVLGWESNIERAWQNFHVDRAPSNLAAGVSANAIIEQVCEENGVEMEVGVKIVVQHSLVPRTGTKSNGKSWVQAAMANKKGEFLMFRDPATNQLKHVYRNTMLEREDVQDVIFKNLEAISQEVIDDIDAPALLAE
jgi:hypothetical protein